MKFKELSKKQKLCILPVFALMFIGGVFAVGYVVNSFTIQSDVYEPFSVSYTILGDSGNYNGEDLCSEVDEEDWVDYSTLGQPIDLQGLYAGESRKFCVKIDNEGEGDIAYEIESKIKTGLGNYNDCVIAFPETTKTGNAEGSDTTIDGQVINVPGNAPPVEDCMLEISVLRG